MKAGRVHKGGLIVIGAAVLSTAALASLAGCGGGANSTTSASSGPRLTRAKYNAEGLRLARRYDLGPDRIYYDFVSRNLARPKCANEVARFQAELAAMLAQARALRPPAAIAGLHRQLIDAASSFLHQVRTAQKRVAAGKLGCGEPVNRRIYGAYSASPIDRIMMKLQLRGYLFSPPGEKVASRAASGQPFKRLPPVPGPRGPGGHNAVLTKADKVKARRIVAADPLLGPVLKAAGGYSVVGRVGPVTPNNPRQLVGAALHLRLAHPVSGTYRLPATCNDLSGQFVLLGATSFKLDHLRAIYVIAGLGTGRVAEVLTEGAGLTQQGNPPIPSGCARANRQNIGE
jgi:hypothetical protein